MAISKKAGKKGGAAGGAKPASSAPPKKGGVAKADWREGFKKPQAGVSDMTLLTTISNEAVNQNLEKRFRNAEIYVRTMVIDRIHCLDLIVCFRRCILIHLFLVGADVHRTGADLCQSVQRFGDLHR